ncbi:hypothetical protein MCUN1_003496 [Malassezia cuniculi]|uniref:Uncharacterized protein n=1 Tax=Malassezia cuniculi TaxID=948313 RepID=A0AAF0EYJ3_9BASI|nr:hypothetical protein MCUN1_003496 [Malassezia cuniculi]
MTLLLRRWLIYYALLPAVIRLIAFQSICWSLVRICLYVFGPSQPIGAWLAISTFTAANDCIARWVTSNITDVQHEEYVSEAEFSASEAEATDPRLERRRRYREGGMWLIRILVGGPLDAAELNDIYDSDSDEDYAKQPLARPVRASSVNISSDHEADNEAPRSLHVPLNMRQRSRHARPRLRKPPASKRASDALFFQNNRAARIHSRRVFHWEVAMWRNVVPIAVLGYITLWVLICGWCMPRIVS